jgi:tRNA pseudouridine55 synthase
MSAQRKHRQDVHGWIILDKPVGMTSTHAVSAVRRLLNAKKAGHAGTLDPLASGILPLAFGEATKTVPYVVDGEKAYRFTVKWGSETKTDDAEGPVTLESDARPDAAAIEALLPRFMGIIEQVPPQFSAIKVDGERAYDLARDGEVVALKAREVEIHALRMIEHSAEQSVFEAECGKGTYVRAIARDLGRALGCFGHIIALRRTRVGPFLEQDSTAFAELEDPVQLANSLRSVESGLLELPCLIMSRDQANRIRRGQSVILRGRDAPVAEGPVYASCDQAVLAIGLIERGEFVPNRVFNLG